MSLQFDKRVVVYPHYISSNKTVQEGRRIPKDLACEMPNVLEMLEVCKHLNIPAVIEDKHYPRDWFIRGRLRVQLRQDDGMPTNTEVPNRRTLLIKLAELVPKLHPDRKKRIQQEKGALASSAAAASASEAGAGPSSSAAAAKAAPSKSSKKKGKGK
mmetsp:Transcript_40470/g.89927  ORF Transcript_40470/g.89927 Transcript_40470/m.89927 type:complete len:157 (+) Transcript_40470:78-548(+)|eukprot:CAMPEP_0202900560 /NCGR_PEP_ID=MMETSP1392-20130828/11907_1 /ASSEMBLY_ACC=CAM_ASM_000868 /TAXON_ID=225041 /ORGANISM="Chlamydomonas chlamydogama, Strain SAG 11-48b" /LENGTH=156 /DNA_ID=CAMNT_0049586975 /DNA_START=78 /DNA_END=548 /DNA_ORIENTATION=-